jgi:hypothetical protein
MNTKRYKIVESGEEEPFKWRGKKMVFRFKASARDVMKKIKEVFHYKDLVVEKTNPDIIPFVWRGRNEEIKYKK